MREEQFVPDQGNKISSETIALEQNLESKMEVHQIQPRMRKGHYKQNDHQAKRQGDMEEQYSEKFNVNVRETASDGWRLHVN